MLSLCESEKVTPSSGWIWLYSERGNGWILVSPCLSALVQSATCLTVNGIPETNLQSQTQIVKRAVGGCVTLQVWGAPHHQPCQSATSPVFPEPYSNSMITLTSSFHLSPLINEAGHCRRRVEGISRIIRATVREKLMFQAGEWSIKTHLPPHPTFSLSSILRSGREGLLGSAEKVCRMRGNESSGCDVLLFWSLVSFWYTPPPWGLQTSRGLDPEARPRSLEWFQVLERWVAQPSANAQSGKLEPPKPRTWNQPSMLWPRRPQLLQRHLQGPSKHSSPISNTHALCELGKITPSVGASGSPALWL